MHPENQMANPHYCIARLCERVDGLESIREEKQPSIDLIFSELRKAEEKHPGWPQDVVHAVAIMVEEAGEAMQAALDVHYRGRGIEDLRIELAQTGAMAIRALIHLEDDK